MFERQGYIQWISPYQAGGYTYFYQMQVAIKLWQEVT